jgi:TPR repeat protein
MTVSGMHKENHYTSNETNTLTPIYSNSWTASADENHAGALRAIAQDLKLAADQGNTDAQCNCGICLYHDQSISIDWKGASYSFKLAADQGYPAAQLNYGITSRKVKGFQLTSKKQYIISNLLMIKEMLLLNPIMGFVCNKVKMFQKI